MAYWFIDGTAARAAELRQLAPELVFEVAELPSGFAASAPEPGPRARDKLLADPRPGFAEAIDLTTMDGKSLRLELDSENETRFCRWWRQTPARLHLCVAYRRDPQGAVEVITAVCDGAIAEKPAGTSGLGWDRLFVPSGQTRPLAALGDDRLVVGPSRLAYSQLAQALSSGN
ncbi:MAG: hypothetical protein KA297_13815 [Kofleriaceae bacterium]|nr:hypothetical protein [Kofleriaceae bacterium]